MKPLKIVLLSFIAAIFAGCNAQQASQDHSVPEQPKVDVQTPDFRDYWYAGEAELSHYDLEQIRYGEVCDGDGHHHNKN